MTENVGKYIDQFLFPKGHCGHQKTISGDDETLGPVSDVGEWKGFFRESPRGEMCTKGQCIGAQIMIDARKKRCDEIRLKKGPGCKLTADDLAYIFNEDNEIIASCIAQLIATKDLQHTMFTWLRRDLEMLGISLDDIVS